MKLAFTYDREKDIWCLLNKGKSSNNSASPTKVYEQLVSQYGDTPSPENTNSFIDKYIIDNEINIEEKIQSAQENWDLISDEYQKRAEKIFGVVLPENITVYTTVNTRCPYNIEQGYFFVSLQSDSVNKTIMHELWHFYTWYSLGSHWVEKLGAHKYNELKESLTVLLNIECADLLPEDIRDTGYPQHQEMREKILKFWEKDKSISGLWEYLVELD